MTQDLHRTLQQLRERIREVPPRAAFASNATLIDVREHHEWLDGHVEGALLSGRSHLEMQIGRLAPDPAAPLILYCQSGVRSLFAAATLESLGYRDVRSIAGGFEAWRAEGLPVVTPDTGKLDRTRYSRHLRIPEIGEAGQRRLLASSVLIVGAGGLGSPAALYLAAAGVGRLTIVDDDRVDRSNLQRQILHNDERIGTLKVDSARRTLTALNPTITVDTHAVRFTPVNARELVADHDVVVDGCDNFPTRYLVNDACVAAGRVNVHGSIHRFDGQVSVFWPGRGPCYRCIHPAPPPDELAPNCAEVGVLGVLPGVIGTLEAVETLKVLLGIGEPLVGRLLTYDALQGGFSEFRLRRSKDCAICTNAPLAQIPAART